MIEIQQETHVRILRTYFYNNIHIKHNHRGWFLKHLKNEAKTVYSETFRKVLTRETRANKTK